MEMGEVGLDSEVREGLRRSWRALIAIFAGWTPTSVALVGRDLSRS
jgi:hypothetical protein